MWEAGVRPHKESDQDIGNMALEAAVVETMKLLKFAWGEPIVWENDRSPIFTEQGKETKYIKRTGNHGQIGMRKTNTKYWK